MVGLNKVTAAGTRKRGPYITDPLPADRRLAASELRYRRLFETAQDGILILDAETGMVVDVNPFLIEMLGYSREQFTGKAVWELGFMRDAIANRDKFLELQRQEYVRYDNLPLEAIDGRRVEVEFVSNVYLVGHEKVIQCNIRDITGRRQVQMRQELGSQILALLNRDSDIRALIRDIIRLIREQAGIEAVGIRLREGDDFPYYETHGFPPGFVEAERHLCARDAVGETVRDTDGRPVLECMCGNVLSGRVDPSKPFFTPYGSFWTNSTSALLATTSEQDRQARTRNRCNGEGYESVALIPLRSGDEVIGLLQLNDHRKGMFTLKTIAFFEELGAGIGIALARQRAVASLKESTSFLGTLLEAIPAPVFYKDTASHYTGFNKAFEALCGKTRAELIGKTAFDIAPRELAEIYHARDLELFRNPGVQVYEAKMKDVQGRMHDVMYHKATFKNAAGDVGGLIGVMLDITERVRAEEEQKWLVTAVEQAAEAIMITDARGTILYVNPAFEKTTGYARAEAVGQNPRILKSGKQDADFYRDMWTTLTAGRVWRGHMTNRRKDGTLYEEDVTLSPVRNAAGEIHDYVAVQRDVSRDVLLESQLRESQKIEAVGRLAGGVAHDFNNMLGIILGYTESAMEQTDASQPIFADLQEIRVAAQRSAGLTRQLLAFARKQNISPKVLDLNDAVTGMLKLLQQLVGEDIHLAWLPGAVACSVRIDPSQVDQILANLCLNARDAIAGVGKVVMETGSILLDADACEGRGEAIPGAYVFLTVSDDGEGMDRDTLSHLFEPFFTTKGVGKGTGLGLATVYGIIRQNHGFITVDSAPGKGTSFKIHLPQASADAGQVPVVDALKAPRGRGQTILLAEDEPSLRVTFRRLLESLGYAVLSAETCADAVELSAQHAGQIHLLLTDVVMPGMNGRQLVERVAAARPGVKVLFMSGHTADVIDKRGVLEEATAFIAKPFTRDELARKVHAVLAVDEAVKVPA